MASEPESEREREREREMEIEGGAGGGSERGKRAGDEDIFRRKKKPSKV